MGFLLASMSRVLLSAPLLPRSLSFLLVLILLSDVGSVERASVLRMGQAVSPSVR